ncbi:hypothetical protein E6Q11_00545 [Candidatus Dojkabacteria bacterium]|uniref:Uncharacterized protein n=1 Tax=Candidatus Dojkabacteria bacterium TaxID=2099670 RepID=A0A5C7JBN9_9BACT|nr:MAG: hypothetical protein E6Q11_00545 [Candidatus Dojkabacteria bacterium]
MTDREPRRQAKEFSPHENPEAFFAYLTPWEIADNTLNFARAGDFILPETGKSVNDLVGGYVEVRDKSVPLVEHAPQEVMRRTIDVSFDHGDENITIYLQTKGVEPKHISARGVALSKRHGGPQEFHYKIYKDRLVVQGESEPIAKDTPEYKRIRSIVGKANLQLSLNLSYASIPPSPAQ